MEEIGNTIYSGFWGLLCMVDTIYCGVRKERKRGRGGRGRGKGEKPWRQICLTHSKMVWIKRDME